MAQSGRKLNLRSADDCAEMLELLAQHGIDLRPEVLKFAHYRLLFTATKELPVSGATLVARLRYSKIRCIR